MEKPASTTSASTQANSVPAGPNGKINDMNSVKGMSNLKSTRHTGEIPAGTNFLRNNQWGQKSSAE